MLQTGSCRHLDSLFASAARVYLRWRVCPCVTILYLSYLHSFSLFIIDGAGLEESPGVMTCDFCSMYSTAFPSHGFPCSDE